MRLAVLLAVTVLIAACGGPAAQETTSKAPVQPVPAAAPPAPVKPAAPPAAAAQPAAAKPAAAKPAATMPSQLVAGAPSQTSSYYVYTVGLAKVLQAKLPGTTVTVSEAGGSAENAKRLQDDQIHLALAAFAGLYPIYAGLDPAFKDKPLKDLRGLWAVDPVAETWFVREDSGITNVEQLQGKDFSGGGRGSGSDQIARSFVFPALGIEPRWYIGGAADVLGAMKDRRIVGMGKASALRNPDATILDAMTSMKIRILGWTPEQVRKVREKYPFLVTTEIPAGVYKADWNKDPIPTWQNGAGMFTIAKLPEDVGYAITKIAVEDSKLADSGQAAAFPAMKGNDVVALSMKHVTIPLHAGAYRYFREVGAQIPDHLKPPEVK